jgi:hypothetical protein
MGLPLAVAALAAAASLPGATGHAIDGGTDFTSALLP